MSIIDELQPGRTPVKTRVFNDKQRARVYEAVAGEVGKGHQAYVVYPLVEGSEKLDLEGATRGADKLRVLPGMGVPAMERASPAMPGAWQAENRIVRSSACAQQGTPQSGLGAFVVPHPPPIGRTSKWAWALAG